MKEFRDTYNDHTVLMTAWYPELQAASVAQVSDEVLRELLDDPRVAYMEAVRWTTTVLHDVYRKTATKLTVV